MNTDYSRYSYIYECLILDKINEISNGDTNEATMYKTILEQLAFRVYDEEQQQNMEESFVLGVILIIIKIIEEVREAELMSLIT